MKQGEVVRMATQNPCANRNGLGHLAESQTRRGGKKKEGKSEALKNSGGGFSEKYYSTPANKNL